MDGQTKSGTINKSSKKRESDVEQKIGWTNADFFVGQKKTDRPRVDFINCFVPYADRSLHTPQTFTLAKASQKTGCGGQVV